MYSAMDTILETVTGGSQHATWRDAGSAVGEAREIAFPAAVVSMCGTVNALSVTKSTFTQLASIG